MLLSPDGGVESNLLSVAVWEPMDSGFRLLIDGSGLDGSRLLLDMTLSGHGQDELDSYLHTCVSINKVM